MKNTQPVWENVEAHKEDLIGMADRVWETPELLYGEYKSCAEHTAMLKQKGFRVTEGVAGIPTAVSGEAGEGGPVIAILGEYDALPGLSQVAGIAERKELVPGGNGHGCGHNLLGSAALLAATGLKDWLAETGTPGRVRYMGCPAEEGGAAKAFMVREGVFDDVDIAITWHPASMTRVDEMISLANTRIDFEFTGKSSHAAASPHLGRSALDAVQLMCVGVNYLREHMPDTDRVHYSILDAGGTAPNVVQGYAKARFVVRSRSLSGMRQLIERVRKVADGAAMMTETTVSSSVMSAVANMLPNQPLAEAMEKALQGLGGVPFDEADRVYAAQIQETLTDEDILAAYRLVGVPRRENYPLCDFVVPLDAQGEVLVGSTDVADVSWKVPTIQARVATHAIGTQLHTWQVTAQGQSPLAHKGMVYAAKAMAQTAVMAFSDPELRDAAHKAHQELLAEEPYVSPLPEDVRPPLQPRPAAD